MHGTHRNIKASVGSALWHYPAGGGRPVGGPFTPSPRYHWQSCPLIKLLNVTEQYYIMCTVHSVSPALNIIFILFPLGIIAILSSLLIIIFIYMFVSLFVKGLSRSQTGIKISLVTNRCCVGADS